MGVAMKNIIKFVACFIIHFIVGISLLSIAALIGITDMSIDVRLCFAIGQGVGGSLGMLIIEHFKEKENA